MIDKDTSEEKMENCSPNDQFDDQISSKYFMYQIFLVLY